MVSNGLKRGGMDWICNGSEWIGMVWIGLDCFGMIWDGLQSFGMYCNRLVCSGMVLE